MKNLDNIRFVVIADYPGHQGKIGDIIICRSKWKEKDKEYYGKFPSIFKPISWYEKRDESEMPIYLKTDKNWSGFSVQKVKVYYGDDREFVEFENNSELSDQCDPNQYCTEWFEPATEEEYTEYKKLNSDLNPERSVAREDQSGNK